MPGLFCFVSDIPHVPQFTGRPEVFVLGVPIGMLRFFVFRRTGRGMSLRVNFIFIFL